MICRSTGVLLVLVTAAVVVPAIAAAIGRHPYWPQVNGIEYVNENNARATMEGTNLRDRLLGGHGNDRLIGRGASDVLVGDFKRSGRSVRQFDRLSGGDGRDFIYASPGTNVISAGGGNDFVNAHWGRGRIDCGPGRDVLFISRKRQSRYSIRGCEIIRHTRHAP